MKRPRSGNTATQHATNNKNQTESVVEVVSCAASFPISQTKRAKYNHHNNNDVDEDTGNRDETTLTNKERKSSKKSNIKMLDWNETVREVQKFGAQGWGAATIRSKKYGNSYTNDDDDNITKHPITNTIMERKKFRIHQNEQYELLTGRKKKQHAVPLPIVRGIKKKAIAREQRILKEAKDSGIVLPVSSLTMTTQQSSRQKEQIKKQQSYKMNQHYGPAPSIGFMKQGMYHVRGNNSNGKNDSSRKHK